MCYDVRDEQRLVQTYKKMSGYGDHMQYSVFMCDLNSSELIMMKEELEDIMNMKEDSLIIVNVGSVVQSDIRITTMGVSLETQREPTIVV